MVNDNRTRIALIITFVLAILLAWYFRGIITYILVSGVFTLIMKPVKRQIDRVRIGRFRVPGWVSAILCLLLIVGVIVSIVSIFIPLVIEEASQLSGIDPIILIKRLKEPIEYLENTLVKYQIAEDSEHIVSRYFQNQAYDFFSTLNFSSIFNFFVNFTGEFFVATFAILFFTFFFLKDGNLPKRFFLSISPGIYRRNVLHILKKSEFLLSRYFVGLIFQVTGITFLAFIGLGLIGVENPLLIGFLAGIFNIIPYLGPLMGAFSAILLAVAGNIQSEFTFLIMPLIAKIIIVFIIVQLIDNLVFQPVIYSKSVKAHPLEIFIIILMAARIAGIPGMIVAIPAYTFLRVILKEFFNTFNIVQHLTRKL